MIACRLLPLDKQPGVRPVGIGEVLRRIIGKALITFLKQDILTSVGPMQLAAGAEGGAEAAIHSMEKIWQQDTCQAILLVDASNAFNRLNRKASLLNVRHICPNISTYLINTYRSPAELYISNSGGKYILSIFFFYLKLLLHQYSNSRHSLNITSL